MARVGGSGQAGSPEKTARSRPTQAVLGIDLGGTKVVSALVTPDGVVRKHSGKHVHANDGPGGVIRTVAASVRACLEGSEERPVAVGMAVAAQVDARTGTVIHAPNLRWRDVPLAQRLEEEIGLPVAVLNDARAATLAEWRHGAGRGTSDFFCLIIGTGVGGSAVLGDRLIEGATGAFGEVGHLTLVAGGRRCHCPNFGCLEAYVGGWAIADRAHEAMVADPVRGRPLADRAGGRELVTARTVFDLYREGDPLAQHLVLETERLLADGAVGIVNAFNPSVLALGGGVVAGLPELIPVVESAIRARCQPPAAVARVVAARFGEDAPLIGAAEYARTRARGTPRRPRP